MKNGVSHNDISNPPLVDSGNNNPCEKEFLEETISRYLPSKEFESQCTNVSNDFKMNDLYVLLDVIDGKVRNEYQDLANAAVGE